MTQQDASLPEVRPGEEVLDFDPAERASARLCFIGRIRTPWSRGDCPRNIGSARESGQPAWIEMAPEYLRGLAGLREGQAMVLIYWMDRARRDLIVQAPRHTEAPRGTFALRSPNRPNPLAMSVVTLRSIDNEGGRIGIDALDCFDGTPLVDMKPWLPSIDAPASAPSA